MNRKVLIIYESEIFRKGLMSIIKNFFNVEVMPFHSFKEFPNSGSFSKVLIIAFVDPSKIDASKLESIAKLNDLKTIAIRSEQKLNYEGKKYDANINYNTSSFEIQEILSQLFNSNQQEKKENSSELTQREKDVLRLVALGHTNKSIAEELFISMHTVISHRKNITEKLGIKSISGLTVYAIINQLVATDSLDLENLI